jgi:hypothetical protein
MFNGGGALSHPGAFIEGMLADGWMSGMTKGQSSRSINVCVTGRE